MFTPQLTCLLSYISGSGWIQENIHIHWNRCWFWQTYLLCLSEELQLRGKACLSHVDQWWHPASWTLVPASSRMETPAPFPCSPSFLLVSLAFPCYFSSLFLSCKLFMCLHSWLRLALFWFVFKVPSELPLVCVLRITNDHGPLVPKCIPDGSLTW